MPTHNDAARDREQGGGRNPFELFVEFMHRRVSGAPFFFLCLLIVLAWGASYPLFESEKEWHAIIHSIGSVLSILLLVLLENANRRSEETAQEKLNVLAEALAALMRSSSHDDPELREALDDLEEAIGLEERH